MVSLYQRLTACGIQIKEARGERCEGESVLLVQLATNYQRFWWRRMLKEVISLGKVQGWLVTSSHDATSIELAYCDYLHTCLCTYDTCNIKINDYQSLPTIR